VPLHANIAGFDLATFRSLVVGPVGPGRADAVVQDVARRLAAASDADVRPVLVRLRQVLDARLRPGSVVQEDGALVHAVIALATTGQRPRWTDADRRPDAFVDFVESFPTAPSDLERLGGRGPGMRTLIGWALDQRPVLGRRQPASGSTYGFLSHDEVGRLLAYHRVHPWLGDHEPDFAAEFFGWLAEIHEAGLDYWFHSSSRDARLPRDHPSEQHRAEEHPSQQNRAEQPDRSPERRQQQPQPRPPSPRVRFARSLASGPATVTR